MSDTEDAYDSIDGGEFDFVACNDKACPYWSEWSAYGECSQPCDGGRRYRTRDCVNGVSGDIGCDQGSFIDSAACNEQVCVISLHFRYL